MARQQQGFVDEAERGRSSGLRSTDPLVRGDRPPMAGVLDLQRRFGNVTVGQMLGARQTAVAP